MRTLAAMEHIVVIERVRLAGGDAKLAHTALVHDDGPINSAVAL